MADIVPNVAYDLW